MTSISEPVEGLRLSEEGMKAVLPDTVPELPDEPGVYERYPQLGTFFEEGYSLGSVSRLGLQWACMAQVAFERSGIWQNARLVDAVTYGFLRQPSGELAFGVCVYTSDDRAWNYVPKSLEVGETTLPVVHMPAQRFRSPHGYPLEHPCQGTTACLALVSNPDGTESVCLLTAGHVVARAGLNGSVDLSSTLFQCQGTGRVAKFGPPRVDAAAVSAVNATQTWITGPPISTKSVVGPGMQTTMRGQAGGIINGVVAQVSNPALAVQVNYGSIEFLILLDRPGRPGDSGALVTDPNTGEAMGLYLGEAEDVTGTKLGRCQLARQVELALPCRLAEWQ